VVKGVRFGRRIIDSRPGHSLSPLKTKKRGKKEKEKKEVQLAKYQVPDSRGWGTKQS